MKALNKASVALNNGNKILKNIETFLLAICTITLVAVIFIGVICRYLLFISTAWAEELSRYLFVWLTYIGSAYALSEGGHIEIDIFKQFIISRKNIKDKDHVLKVFEIMSLICTMSFLLIFSYIFWGYMMRIWGTNQTSPTMHIPMGLVYLPVFVGSLISIYHVLYLIFNSLLALKPSQDIK